MNPRIANIDSHSEPQSINRVYLSGPWLTAARLNWMLISLIAVAMLIVGLVTNMHYYWT